MRRLTIALATGALTFAVMGIAATAGARPASTFVVVMNAAEEVPHCAPATNAARGVATFRVTNEATGTVEWKIVANNLPGTPVAAHIHLAPKGTAGGVIQPLPPTAGEENGVIGEGTFTNPALLAAIRLNPSNYYVNVHSTVCGAGVIRGQFGDHGP
jgi:CHRD domain-containing protein